jgi:prepilin-type N-terminal cleavage/methylation domain-containing protein
MDKWDQRIMKPVKSAATQQGLSLMELMIVAAIIGIIMAIAVPQYQDYIATAREGAMLENMNSIRLFQEEARLSQGAYQAGTYNPADPNASGGLTELIGWAPRTTTDEITYVVSDVTASSFTITATHSDGTTVQRDYNTP